MAVANRELEGLVVSMPPRHGKSLLIDRFFPVWYLGRNPDHRVILGSHEGNLARSWGRKARETFIFASGLFGLTVQRDSHAADHWSVAGHEGGMDTAGVGGSFTGRGGNIIIFDDPIKNSEEALSKNFREKVWDFWMSTVETRAEPGCGFVLVQTRWHQDDLAGRVIKEISMGVRKKWEIIKLPALAQEDDPLKRPLGAALWPSRFPVETLENLRNRWDHDEARLGPYWWSALYQQEPTPKSGRIFKKVWFRYFSEDQEHYKLHLPATGAYKVYKKTDCYNFMSVDLAVSQKETADFCAFGVWAVTPDRHLLLVDCLHDRIEAPEQLAALKTLNKRWRPVTIGIESNAYQLALVQHAWAGGLPAKAYPMDKDKVSRAQLAATLFSASRIYFRSGSSWLTQVEDELLQFPNAQNDDLVDMNSLAARQLCEGVVPAVD